MANRFRAVSPAQAFAAKVRWLVGCLILIILVLTITLVAVVQKVEMNSATIDAPPAPAAQIAAPTIEVLFTTRHVEEGEKFEDALMSRSMSPDQVPRDVFSATAKSMVLTKAAARNIDANMPITPDMVTEPRTDGGRLMIPQGFVAVAITLDPRQKVDDWAGPGKRVNINVTFTNDKGKRAIITIVRGVKILSVARITQSSPGAAPVANVPSTVTLQVTEEEASKVELARSNGELSLVLISDQASRNPEQLGGSSTALTWEQVYKGSEREPTRVQDLPAPDGIMYKEDPKTGRQERWELRGKSWKRVESS